MIVCFFKGPQTFPQIWGPGSLLPVSRLSSVWRIALPTLIERTFRTSTRRVLCGDCTFFEGTTCRSVWRLQAEAPNQARLLWNDHGSGTPRFARFCDGHTSDASGAKPDVA
jgi:hypothetical protein